MTPEEIGARLAALLGTAGRSPSDSDQPSGAGAVTGTLPTETGTPSASTGDVALSVSGGGTWARATVDVPLSAWRAAIITGRDDPDLSFDFFDWLSAVDEEAGGFSLVVHVWSSTRRHGALVRTRLTDRDGATAPSIVDIYPGAAWHERETREMFGIRFTDPDDARPLLLPPEFEGHPLRKDFVLAARVAKPWPGAKEPGESGHGTAKRQPMRPPGVPDPREWGPMAGEAPADEPPARPARATRPPREPGAVRPDRPAPADKPDRGD